jgi:hypothetical protein
MLLRILWVFQHIPAIKEVEKGTGENREEEQLMIQHQSDQYIESIIKLNEGKRSILLLNLNAMLRLS